MSTTSQLAGKLAVAADPFGDQVPRIRWVPPGRAGSSGAEAVELAASAGLLLDPWQELVLEDALAERADGRWLAFEFALLVARQNGKGSVLEARELFALFLGDERLILHSAHEFKTCHEAFIRIRDLVDSSDSLRKRVKNVTEAHGNEGITLRNGKRLRFVARTGGSGRGFTGDLVILDEAYNLGPAQMSALMPTLAARPNPQIWYTSSAGDEKSEQLIAVRERGIAGNAKRLAYLEWSAPDDSDPTDVRAIQQANPALGRRISLEYVEDERDGLPEQEFARERLSIWPRSGGYAVIDADLWGSRFDSGSRIEPESPLAFAVEVSADRSATSIGSFGLREDGKGHVELIKHEPGTWWVVNELVRLNRAWRPVAIALNPNSPTGSLVDALVAAGIKPLLLGEQDMARASGAFYDAVVQDELKHGTPDGTQVQLAVAVEAGRKESSGQSWKWTRKTPTDISPLIAVTEAKWAFDQPREPVKGAPNLW